jgi:hypothetical protein
VWTWIVERAGRDNGGNGVGDGGSDEEAMADILQDVFEDGVRYTVEEVLRRLRVSAGLVVAAEAFMRACMG